VNKYDLVFSGAQFLLGPDRRHALTEAELFARWSIVQLGGVMVAAVGARLALSLPAAAIAAIRGRREAARPISADVDDDSRQAPRHR